MSKRGYQFLFLLPIGFLVVFFLYPILSILQRSLQPAAFVEVVQKASFAKVLWFTLWQAVVSTLLTLLVALPAAYLFGRFRFPGKTALRALSTVPFVMPTVVVATAFRALLGPRGWVNLSLQSLFDLPYAPLDLERTVGLILLAHVFYNYAVVVRIVGGYWSNLSQHTEEAASVLGANRWRVFRLVTLPALMPAIVTASLLIFLFTFTSFGVILILGGPGFSTLETEIYRQAMSFLDLPSAAVLSVIQIFITYGVMLAYSVLSQRSTVPVRFQARRELQKR
ncbi:MAG: ABC transporter permease subunit, partial [Chloroflexota bacterium]